MSALKAIYSTVTTVVLTLATYVVVSTFVNLFETKGRDCYLSSLPCLTYELMFHDDCGQWRVIQQGGATAPIAGATTQPTRGRISFATRATALGTLPACAPMVKGTGHSRSDHRQLDRCDRHHARDRTVCLMRAPADMASSSLMAEP